MDVTGRHCGTPLLWPLETSIFIYRTCAAKNSLLSLCITLFYVYVCVCNYYSCIICRKYQIQCTYIISYVHMLHTYYIYYCIDYTHPLQDCSHRGLWARFVLPDLPEGVRGACSAEAPPVPTPNPMRWVRPVCAVGVCPLSHCPSCQLFDFFKNVPYHDCSRLALGPSPPCPICQAPITRVIRIVLWADSLPSCQPDIYWPFSSAVCMCVGMWLLTAQHKPWMASLPSVFFLHFPWLTPCCKVLFYDEFFWTAATWRYEFS